MYASSSSSSCSSVCLGLQTTTRARHKDKSKSNNKDKNSNMYASSSSSSSCSSVWLGLQTTTAAAAAAAVAARRRRSLKPRIVLQEQRSCSWTMMSSSSSFFSSSWSSSSSCCTALRVSVREICEVCAAAAAEEGPVELLPEIDPFAIPETTPLQAVASILLTGAITVLLIRAVRRRSKRAKEMKFRSSGEESAARAKSIKEQAQEAAAIRGLTKAPEVEGPRLSPLQTFSGALLAAVIALVLYKFTTTVEAGFTDKAVSSNYSIRNLTITVRTIITGLCYLATFVFAANSIGLTLYSLQLALNLNPPSSSSSSPTNDLVDKRELLSESPSSEEERSSEQEQR